MAYKCREEIVGKRFLSVSNFTKLKTGKISEWGWRAGVIRAATHKDNHHPELQVLVEYDDVEWHRREWISVYKDKLFHLFMVEQGLAWVERRDPFSPTSTMAQWPALTFSSLVSAIELTSPPQLQPVEFLLDRELAFEDYKHLKPFQEWDSSLPGVRDYPELKAAVRRWAEQQDGQRILLTTPSVLVGYRVEVYRAEGTTQWYTAVIVGYNEATRDLTVTDDTVLEEHNEDPALVQMRLIGDGVVESIMRGENVGITPRRSRSAVLQTQHQQQPSRVVRGLSVASNSATSVNGRKQRPGKPSSVDRGASSPEPSQDKGSNNVKSRKRKVSESSLESNCTKGNSRHNNNSNFNSNSNNNNLKEDLENKQSRKNNKNLCNNNRSLNKKKVLEEANNSKLREIVAIRTEDCLQTVSHNNREKKEDDEQEVENGALSAVCRRKRTTTTLLEEESAQQHDEKQKHEKIVDKEKLLIEEEEDEEVVDEEIDDDDGVLDDASNGSSVQLVATPSLLLSSSATTTDEVVQCDNVRKEQQQAKQEENHNHSSKKVRCDSMLSTSSCTVTGEVVSEEDDCVIVAAATPTSAPHHHPDHSTTHYHHHRIQTPKIEERECSSRGDDDGPLSSSSPFSSRMDLSDSANASSLLLRFPDDRSDSGVSSLRSSSGDERSGSRSSALSSSDEPQNTSTSNNSANITLHQQTIASNLIQQQHRSPLYLPSTQSSASSASAPNNTGHPHHHQIGAAGVVSAAVVETVRVWRDPNLLLESEPHVRHIHSVQHQTLLMSHPSTPAVSGPPPPGSSAAVAASVASQQQQQQQHSASLYPPPPTLMTPHPLQHHPHLPPTATYPHHPQFDMIWKQQFRVPPHQYHLLSQPPGSVEELYDRRDRAIIQDRHDRMIRQNQQDHRELEKLKEKDRLERERAEREKYERDREREKERERELEKERQEQALHNHFEKSLRKAAQQQKRGEQWNLMSARPPQPRPNSSAEEERKRVEQEMHQREQRHLSSVRSERDHRPYYQQTSQRPPSVPSKADYPPPPAAHSRIPPSSSSKPADKMSSLHPSAVSLQKSNTDLNMYGYPACQPSFFPHEPKNKVDLHKSQSSLVVTKTNSGGIPIDTRDILPNPPPLMSEIKNSVIVKHDGGGAGGKNSHHLEPRVSMAHSSPSPNLRSEIMTSHYLSAAAGQPKTLYEYRSPTQSPHHHLSSHTPSPHHHLDVGSAVQAQNLGKSSTSSHHRSSSNQNNNNNSSNNNQLPSPHHQRQSPHNHPQQHPSPELRYRSSSAAESAAAVQQAMIYPSASAKGGYSYMSSAAAYSLSTANTSNSKPKVSSPAPHHIYGKPSAGIVSGVPPPPITRTPHEPTITPIQLTSKPPLSSSVSPSPYQQVSQYHPPHPQQPVQTMTCPPPAHSRTTPSSADSSRYDRMYPGSALSVNKVQMQQQHGTSPPTAASAPMPPRSTHSQYGGSLIAPQNLLSGASVQTQPLDLGVSSNSKYENAAVSPKRKAVTPLSTITTSSASPVCLEVKKRRIDQQQINNSVQQQQQQLQQPMPIYVGQPQLARVSEPSPLIASAATTITTVVNTAAYRTPPINSLTSNHSPNSISETTTTSSSIGDVSVTQISVENSIARPSSVESSQIQHHQLHHHHHHSSSSPAPTPVPLLTTTAAPTINSTNGGGSSTQTQSDAAQNREAATTPLKTVVAPPSCVDSEKSNSPGPTNKTNSAGGNGSSYPVRHLKKAWLQRHTGEDLEDNTGVTGSGSCVTLPIMNLNVNNKDSSSTTATTMHSIHSIGSMAVNSISKTKHFSNKSNSRKTPNKETLINGDASKSAAAVAAATTPAAAAGDDSSSSDQDRGRKSPPKRKPPKVKRKKGASTSSNGSKKGSNVSATAATSASATTAGNEEKKRKQSGGGPAVLATTVAATAAASESGSDSEKESGSEKDSDSGASTTLQPPTIAKKTSNSVSSSSSANNKEPRKRGRRPKSSKNDKGEEPRAKKSKDEQQQMPQRDPFRKPPVGQLKKTGESFLQDGPCFEVAPKLAKCRECRWTPNQRSKNMPNIFCRFYAFRRLRYTKNGQLAIAGFSDPHKDALEEDLKLWLPNTEIPPVDLDLETSRFILKQVGDHFCDLFIQEKDVHAEYVIDDKTVAWKRVVQGVREMCDVCETTLFNFHWACGKCGFVVCLDCYKSRKSGSIKVWGEPGKDRDEYSWLLCTNRQAHEQEKLMLTQIIAGDSLLQLGKLVHEMRDLWNIEQYCACPTSKEVLQKSNNIVYKEIIKKILLESKLNGLIKKEIKEEHGESNKTSNGIGGGAVVKDEKTSPLSWLADVALSNEDNKKNDDNNDDGEDVTSSDSEEGNFSTLRELLIRPSHKPNGSRAGSPVTTTSTTATSQQMTSSSNKNNNKKQSGSSNAKIIDTLDEVISSVIEDSVPKAADFSDMGMKPELKHFHRRYNWHVKGRAPLPIRIMTLTESKTLYPDVPHSWLCDGKLLRLSDPQHKDNYKIFQDQWKRGQPVIVSDVTRNLDKDLWNPECFARDFGDEKNDLVNCMNGSLVPNQPMRKFWDGFDHLAKRLKDEKGSPMLLKLKDWPPGEDFAEVLPTRFADLMKVLPLSDYTHRTGRLNLASRLPDCFVRPDLGPKMYNAYGSALHPSKGTTNLHLDISDAVNVMVYVGIPKDGDSDEHIKEAFRAIDEAGCDILTRRRVRDKGELPGALWHIYNARDADKIRDLLNKVVVEKGGRLEPNHDPIHDQSCYLDGPLRERLYKEYGVEGYAIVQCLGDAVFIPAGAPHQVRNLHNCIKVAEDFVSPENVSHCFHLTQEFRDLSDTHTNHEDKLQIKNIIYHAIKDAISCISAVLNRHVIKSERDVKRSPSSERNGDADGGPKSPTTTTTAAAAAMDCAETAA